MSSPGVILQDPDEGVTVRESMASASMDSNAPLFGRYRAMRELGRGGMGMVVLAHDTVLNVPVALKLIPETVVRDTEGISDLKKEVLRGMELTHPNIVRVFSFEEDAKTAVIVMEHVQGETLAQKKALQPHRCFEWDEVLPWLEQLCAALDYAHKDAQIAHRDLKPGNLMLTPAGRLKVADFGIASSLSDTMSRVSVRKDTAGTPPYMSPQQAMGERPTHLDDIYSLGATIYELITGKPPFFRGNILAQLMHEVPPSMAQRRAELQVTDCADIPDAWEKMVAACLSKQPDARPGSGAAVLAMLTHPERALVARPSNDMAGMKLAVVEPPQLAQTIHLSAVTTPPREQPKQIARRKLDLEPVFDTCASVIRGTVEIIGAVLKPFVILAIIIAALWGGLFIKQKWDASQAQQADLAAKQAAAAAAAHGQSVAAPAPAAPPQVIYLPPPPMPHERGVGPGPGGPHPGGPGPGGGRPLPPRR